MRLPDYSLVSTIAVWSDFDVRYWHKADMLNAPMNVCFRGQSGHSAEDRALAARFALVFSRVRLDAFRFASARYAEARVIELEHTALDRGEALVANEPKLFLAVIEKLFAEDEAFAVVVIAATTWWATPISLSLMSKSSRGGAGTWLRPQ